jgi:hypothetical protein
MFVVGITIFIFYIVGYLTMVNRQNEIQRKGRNAPDIRVDVHDFDGHGNWGRFSTRKTVRRSKKYTKTL